MPDVDVRQFFESAKGVSDRRARLGLPLDGNYDSTSRFHEGRESSGGGGGSLLGILLVGIAYFVFYAAIAAVIVGGFVLKLILTAIFSRGR